VGSEPPLRGSMPGVRLDQAVWQGRRARDNNNAAVYKSYVVRPRTFGATIAYRF